MEALNVDAGGGKVIPCIYVAACGDCSGIPDAIRVHLHSGEAVDVENVIEVRVTDSEIILQPAEDPARAFPRANVFYAGCARCLPPFLS
jgi:hypothetical protein